MRPATLRPTLALLALLTLVAAFAAPSPAPAQVGGGQQVHLPLVQAGRGQAAPPSSQVFGVEMSRVLSETGLELMTTSGTRWVRRNALLWKEIEPVPGGGYNWDVYHLKELELEMLNASRNNLNLILVVRGSPTWAVSPYKADCAPVNPQHYASFARFMRAVVERYSKPPFNVKYWELGNEPDAPVRGDDFIFGCWGQPDDPYYGGRAYGEMLKAVYPAIKAADPGAQVLNGGLLLDRPYNPADDQRSRLGRFFEGMLVAGAGNSFDILSFHAYTFWYTPGQPPLGDSRDWRIAYLNGLLTRYNASIKPMIRTEAALLCVTITPECRWAQADLVGRMFARTMRDGLLATIWYVYDSDSYHNTALIEPGDVFVPRPAYFAYRHAAKLLNDAKFVSAVAGLPAGVEGYAFRRQSSLVYIFWTDQGGEVPVPLKVAPERPVACSDRAGAPLTCPREGEWIWLSVGQGPVYVVVD